MGLIAGALAKLIMPATIPAAASSRSYSGIAEPWLAVSEPQQYTEAGASSDHLIATIGAIILLAIYRAVAGGRTAGNE